MILISFPSPQVSKLKRASAACPYFVVAEEWFVDTATSDVCIVMGLAKETLSSTM